MAGKGKDAQGKQNQTSAQQVLAPSHTKGWIQLRFFHTVPFQAPAGAQQRNICFLAAAIILDFIPVLEKLFSDYVRRTWAAKTKPLGSSQGQRSLPFLYLGAINGKDSHSFWLSASCLCVRAVTELCRLLALPITHIRVSRLGPSRPSVTSLSSTLPAPLHVILGALFLLPSALTAVHARWMRGDSG